jgi:uncharacterized protein YbjT (DUF2867 family)
MILVTTAGKVGSEAVLLLRQQQVPVRVLMRTPERATALADAGAEIAVGDLDAPPASTPRWRTSRPWCWSARACQRRN